MSQIDDHLIGQPRSRRLAEDVWIEQVRRRQATLLKRMVRAGVFLHNDSVQAYVDELFEKLIDRNNLSTESRLILVMNSAESNAACYGSGVFIVTTGLLANMQDEASLAFILAHEVAHDELLHVQQTLRAMSHERNPATAFARILLTDVDEKYIDAFRSTMYAGAAMSRDHEMQADSLALSFIQGAGYAAESAERALRRLASLRQANMTKLFETLNFHEFPFKEHWLDERLKIYHRKPVNTFLWSFDSLRSHPLMEKRIAALAGYPSVLAEFPCDRSATIGHAHSLPRFSELMAFQSIEAAYQTNQYDIALFNLLRQLAEHPHHPYLVMRATGIFIDTYHAKNEGDISSVSQFTSNLSDSERLVNNLLFNLSKEEVAELAYHLINNRDNFDPSSASHYYLLWQTCELTSRNQVKSKVAAAYRERFGTAIELYRID